MNKKGFALGKKKKKKKKATPPGMWPTYPVKRGHSVLSNREWVRGGTRAVPSQCSGPPTSFQPGIDLSTTGTFILVVPTSTDCAT